MLRSGLNYFSGLFISHAGDFFYISIEDEPRVLGDTGEISEEHVQKAQEYVMLNQKTFLALWEEDIDVWDGPWQRVPCDDVNMLGPDVFDIKWIPVSG